MRGTLCAGFLAMALMLGGCMSALTGGLTDNLSRAIQNSDDPATVEAGGPAFLLMVDGMIYDDPNNDRLLRAAADIYAAYAVLCVTDADRGRRLTEKAVTYALRGLCARRSDACGLRDLPFEGFAHRVDGMDKGDVPAMYALGTAWAAWVQARKEDWNAIAQISRIEKLMQRVILLDETYRDGGAHLYMGILATLTPQALGGRPQEAVFHFKRAKELSGGKNLMVDVAYARQYARMVFDRPLHDELLKDVLKKAPEQEGYTLLNIQAQREAKQLLEEADDYF